MCLQKKHVASSEKALRILNCFSCLFNCLLLFRPCFTLSMYSYFGILYRLFDIRFVQNFDLVYTLNKYIRNIGKESTCKHLVILLYLFELLHIRVNLFGLTFILITISLYYFSESTQIYERLKRRILKF